MATLNTYQILDKELPTALTVVLMALSFAIVLVVLLLKRCCSKDDDKGKMALPVIIEIVELYFPNTSKGKGNEDDEIEVYDQEMSRKCFSFMSTILIPAIVGTMFITFWDVYLVEESVGGDCEANFDCFPKNGSDFLQQEPVNNCSVFQFNSNVTYECYRLVFRYAEGLGAAGGILAFSAVFSKLYFSLLVTVYNIMKGNGCCRCTFYVIIWAVAASIFILFIGISCGVPEMRKRTFETVTDQIQFTMYAFSLLVIIVSGVITTIGIKKNTILK